MDKINSKLYSEAKKHLVGGVDSPVRSFNYVGGLPLLVKKGKGAKVYDYDGNSYIDYVLSFGALILGHAHPEVVKEAKIKIGDGFSFGATNKNEVELARTISKAIPFIERIRFVNSGTEAVMGALRLARGFTKRDKIIKFSNSFHGSADYLLVKSGSGLATLNIPASAGVPGDFIKHTLIAPYGDISAVEKLFRKHGSGIAGIIVEPVGGNYGVIPPDLNFLNGLRRITRESGALLIFDEVITGFRFHFGSIAQEFGIIPDLICLGKIIGGGLPIGAFGGRKDIMQHLAPEGDVYQASTFAGNPVVMQAGLSTLKILSRSSTEYKRINALGDYLSQSLRERAVRQGVDLDVANYKSMFSVRFRQKPQFRAFYRYLLKKGVYFAPSEFEANFLSFTHGRVDIDKTLAVTTGALQKIGG
jgi:glutamate-1-semialdehyde 2,1-aminomutase